MFELTELPAEIVDFPDDELVAALLDDSYYPCLLYTSPSPRDRG